MTFNHSALLHQLCDLILNYSRTFRATTQPSNLAIFQEQFPQEVYNPANKIYRESLLEHTGSLPIIASFLHPHLENQVDLGKSLQMLAFHDIGETVLGDINTFVKTDLNKKEEYEIAISLIHPSQKPIFDEFERLETVEAKFAKAVDKIAPDIMDFLNQAEITKERFAIQIGKKPAEILPLIMAKKSPFMEFDTFMKDFHQNLMKELEKKLN